MCVKQTKAQSRHLSSSATRASLEPAPPDILSELASSAGEWDEACDAVKNQAETMREVLFDGDPPPLIPEGGRPANRKRVTQLFSNRP